MSLAKTNSTGPDYETIQSWVDAAERRLSTLTAEMQRPPRSLALDYTPRWGKAPAAHATTRTRQDIQRDKDRVKSTIMARVERATANASPNTRQQVRDGVFGRLYAEEIKKVMAAERGLVPPADSWTLDDRQMSMRLEIKIFRERQQQKAHPEARTLDEMTDRFLQKLKVPTTPVQPGSTSAPVLDVELNP